MENATEKAMTSESKTEELKANLDKTEKDNEVNAISKVSHMHLNHQQN